MPARTAATDRRVERTRRALTAALMALMQERGWDEIDVRSLCERADIGRSTFYEHFPNKEELLKSSVANLKRGLLAAAASGRDTADPLGFVAPLVAHVHEAQDMFRALLMRRSGQYVQDRFREMMVELVLAGEPPGAARKWEVVARAHYLAASLFELLVWWLGSNRPHRPLDIETLYRRWSTAVLASDTRAASR